MMPENCSTRPILSCLLLLGLSPVGWQAAHAQPGELPRFEKEVIDAGFEGGYAVRIADIDSDGRQDILALAYRPSELAWYRNTDWQKHVIDTGQDGLIEVAPHDIDGDGAVDLALASEFNLADSESGGQVSWLRNPGRAAVATTPAWSLHAIDAIPTSHRLRWADLSGTGTPVLVNLPIIGQGAAAPQYAGGAGLTAYSIPEDPAGPWGHVVLADIFEMAHGLAVTDWDDEGRDELLTAGYGGVHLVDLATDGEFVRLTNLVEATFTERPQAGISEVVTGGAKGDQRFLATIEPWHGSEVVVYRRADDGSRQWSRQQIDDGLVSGHALITVDLDNDGRDEIVAGGRGEPYSLFIYRHDGESDSWRRTVLDRDVAVSGLAAADLDGNGYQDIIAVGSQTANVVIYHNMGR